MSNNPQSELDRIAELFKGRNGGSRPQTANGAMLLEIAQQLVLLRATIESNQSERSVRDRVAAEIMDGHRIRPYCEQGPCTCSQAAAMARGMK